MSKKTRTNKMLLSTIATAVVVSVLPTAPIGVEAATGGLQSISTSAIKTISITDITNANLVDIESGYIFNNETLTAFKDKVDSMYGVTNKTLTKLEVQNILRIATEDLKVKHKGEALALAKNGTAEEKLTYVNNKILEYKETSHLSVLVDLTLLNVFKGLNTSTDLEIDKIDVSVRKASTDLENIKVLFPGDDTAKYKVDKSVEIMTNIQSYPSDSETKVDLLSRYNHKMDNLYNVEMELINLIEKNNGTINTLSFADYQKLEEAYSKIPDSNKARYELEIKAIKENFEVYLESTGYGGIYKQIKEADVKTLTQNWFTTVRTEISKVINISIRTELTTQFNALENEYKDWQTYLALKAKIEAVDVTKATVTSVDAYRIEIPLLNVKLVDTKMKDALIATILSKNEQINKWADLLTIEKVVTSAKAGELTKDQLTEYAKLVRAIPVASHNTDKVTKVLAVIEQLQLDNVEFADYSVIEKKAKNVIANNLGYERAVDVFLEIKTYQAVNDKSTYFGDSAKMLIELKNYTDTLQGTTKFNIAKKYEADNITGKDKTVAEPVVLKAITLYELVNHKDYKTQVEDALEWLKLVKLGLSDSEESRLEINAINAYNDANRRVLSQVYVTTARSKQTVMYTGTAKTEMDIKLSKLEAELAKVKEIQTGLGEFSQVDTSTITNEKLDKIKTSIAKVEHELSKQVLTTSQATYSTILSNVISGIETDLNSLEKATRVYEVQITLLERKLAGLNKGYSKYTDYTNRITVLKQKVTSQSLLERVNDYIRVGEVGENTVTTLKAEFTKATNIDSATKTELDKQFKLLDEVLGLQKQINEIKVQLDKAHSEGITEAKLNEIGDKIAELPKGNIKDKLAKQVTELGYAFKQVSGVYTKTVTKTELLKGVEISKGIKATVPHGVVQGVKDTKTFEITYTEVKGDTNDLFTISIKDGTSGKVISGYAGGIVLTFSQDILELKATQTLQITKNTSSTSDGKLVYYSTPNKATTTNVSLVLKVADGKYAIKNKNVRFFKDTANITNGTYINKLVERGIINGTTQTTYEPNKNITRGQFSAMLIRSLGLSTIDNSHMDKFYDTTAYWGKNDIDVLTDLGIINGYGDGSFKPNGTLTRQHASMIIHRALVNIGYDVSGVGLTKAQVEAKYKDSNKMSAEGKLSIGVLTELGILKGKSDGTFDPNGNLTRDQMSQVLYKTLELVGYIN